MLRLKKGDLTAEFAERAEKFFFSLFLSLFLFSALFALSAVKKALALSHGNRTLKPEFGPEGMPSVVGSPG